MNHDEDDFTMHLKLPPKKIFAYKHSTPGNSVMGVAVDANTGKILEAVILPTKQRVMLGLGIGNKAAQAHHTYRTFGGKQGYQLIWIDDPDTDPRTAFLKNKLVTKAQELIAAPKPEPIEEGEPIKEAEQDIVGELTAQLVKGGINNAKEEAQEKAQEIIKTPDKAEGFF